MVSKPHTELIRQRRQLSAWLHEWNLEQRLRRVDMGAHEPAPESALTSAPLRAYPRRGEFTPGRILLMPPRSSISPARPLFILLLAELKSGVCLIAPFSRFSAPALPGEWRTGHKAAPLRVLCLWNARGVLRSVLETAWPAARMSAVKTRRALAIWRCIWQEDAAPGAPSRNTGPPLRHPLDPRHEYIAEELELLDAAIAMPGQQGGRQTAGPAFPALYDWKPEALQLAAEQENEYGGKGGR